MTKPTKKLINGLGNVVSGMDTQGGILGRRYLEAGPKLFGVGGLS